MPGGITAFPQPSEVGSIAVRDVVRAFVGKTAAPTVNDDIDQGYIVGDIWIDETNDDAYQCLDNSNGAAVWAKTTLTNTIEIDTINESTADAGVTIELVSFEDGEITLIDGSTIGYTFGSELVTGTDSDMSGANNWISTTLGTFDVNTTVAGKMYMLGNGGGDRCRLLNVFTVGKRYTVSLKARLNTGAGKTIRVYSHFGNDFFSITPTGTESVFSGYLTAASVNLIIGLDVAGFNGMAFEIDDVSVKEIIPTITPAGSTGILIDGVNIATFKTQFDDYVSSVAAANITIGANDTATQVHTYEIPSGIAVEVGSGGVLAIL